MQIKGTTNNLVRSFFCSLFFLFFNALQFLLHFLSSMAWQTFCSDIEKTTDAARLRKILSKTAAPLGYLQKADGSWSDSSKIN